MKKLFLLLTIGSIGLAATAQENRSVLLSTSKMDAKVAQNKAVHATGTELRHGANKGTATATSRWYNYANYLDTFMAYGASGNGTSLTAVNIWNDTSSQLNYTSGLAHLTMTSVGSVFQPQAAGFNSPLYYAGSMQLTNEAFKIDSVNIYGLYLFNPAKTAIVDTLTITFTQGSTTTSADDIFFGWFTDATLLGNYGLASTARLSFAMVGYDSVTNTGAGATAYTFKVPMTSAMWGDTFTNGIFHQELALPVAYNVNSNNQVGVTLSFKSGDPSFIFGDTLNDQYNHFRPLYSFVADAGDVAQFAPYDSTDLNSGQFKTLPNFENGWGDVYVPMYAWTSGGSASGLQHNNMDIHVVCTSCSKMVSVGEVVKNVTNVSVYPNPAQSQVVVTFGLNNANNATVTLSNTLGQVVATQVANGKATFNTSALASGVYIYSIVANGETTTGRITVAH